MVLKINRNQHTKTEREREREAEGSQDEPSSFLYSKRPSKESCGREWRMRSDLSCLSSFLFAELSFCSNVLHSFCSVPGQQPLVLAV